jgi:D-alanyl-D-alanine-carboxypeptidase/D-alanyl-D-alanine-endopeptidase
VVLVVAWPEYSEAIKKCDPSTESPQRRLCYERPGHRTPMRLLRLSLFCAAFLLSACGGGGDDDAPAVGAPTPSRFAQVDAAANAAFVAQGISGMGLSIYDRNGVKVFERMYGTFSADQRVAIASASKLVSGVVIFSLIDKNYLSLDSTTGTILGWTGPQAAITLRQLLSFTSGLPPSHACTAISNITLADCVDLIAQETLIATPGTRFDYGSTHLHVAARMAEVQTNLPWNTIFANELRTPLGLSALVQYYTSPRAGLGTTNPLIAGGMRASMNEYARILQFVYDKGRWQGSQLIGETVFNAQAVEPYPNVVIGNSPAPPGWNVRYGLAAWLECTTPATGCTSISSPGAFGFMPWIDRTAGYYAILGMEIDNATGVVNFAVNLEQQLKPLIATAINQ